jgi:hypothetical protein
MPTLSVPRPDTFEAGGDSGRKYDILFIRLITIQVVRFEINLMIPDFAEGQLPISEKLLYLLEKRK